KGPAYSRLYKPFKPDVAMAASTFSQTSPRLLPDFSQTSLGGARGHDANAKEIGSVDDDFVQTWLGVGVLRIDLFEMVTQNTSDTDVARPLAIRGNDVPRCIVS
ncbi:MAG: hypothetical protein ACI8RC_000377, partial [Ilumatobacter sp.]